MEFKNTWTRIAARWEENKSFKDLLQQQFDNDGDLQSLFYKIEGIDTILSFFDFYKQENPNSNISKRLLKFSEVYDNNNQSLGVYLSDIFNIDYGQTDITNSHLAIDKIKTIKDYIDENGYLLNDVNSYINTLYDIINSIQVDDDIEKAQKQKVLQTIKIKGDKLIKSCNDFKMLLKNELKEDNFRPFYFIYNSDKEILTDDADYFENVDYVKENFTEFGNPIFDVQIKKFNSDGDADRWIQNFWSDEYETDDEYKRTWDEYVEKNGESPETPSDLGYATLYVGYIKTPKDLKNIESLLTF